MSNKTPPLVSIVIPTFNGLPYLEEAIESVLCQTYKNVELIVLDDGSTDQTSAFMQKYKEIFFFESHENMGQAKTLNKGWAAAHGDIIGYLSADDVLTPDAVEITVNYFLNNPKVVLTYPDNILIDNQSRFIRTYHAPDYDYYKMIKNAACQIGVGAFMLKSAFAKVGAWNHAYRLMPDFEHQIRLAQIGDFIHIPKILGHYRIHEQSTMFGKVSSERADENILLMKSLLSTTSDPLLIGMKTQIIGKSYLISARTHWRSNRFLKGSSYFLKAFYLSPSLLLAISTYRIILNALLNRLLHRSIRFFRNHFTKGKA